MDVGPAASAGAGYFFLESPPMLHRPDSLTLAAVLLLAAAVPATAQGKPAPPRTPVLAGPLTPPARAMDPIGAPGLALRPKDAGCPQSTACTLGVTINGLAYAGAGRYWVTDFSRGVLRLLDVENGCGEL